MCYNVNTTEKSPFWENVHCILLIMFMAVVLLIFIKSCNLGSCDDSKSEINDGIINDSLNNTIL